MKADSPRGGTCALDLDLVDLHQSNGSEIAAQALVIIGRLYEIERQTESMEPDERWRIRQTKAKPIMNRYRQWLTLQRQRASHRLGIRLFAQTMGCARALC